MAAVACMNELMVIVMHALTVAGSTAHQVAQVVAVLLMTGITLAVRAQLAKAATAAVAR